jgi:nucleotide-binding universal stress UspA family protein
MKLLQNILVPVDFSESALNALRYAAGIAELFSSEIMVLHVLPEQNLEGETEKLLKESVRSKFEKLKTTFSDNIFKHMQLVIVKGNLFEQINLLSIQHDVDVVIAGEGNDQNGRLSTTIEKVMRKNQVPLWLVKKNDQLPISKILCPVDFSDASVRALKNAIMLTSKLRAELTIMHVYRPIHISSPRLSVDHDYENKVREENAKQEFKSFLDQFDLEGISTKTSIISGSPEIQIPSEISRNETDLLIMGTTGRTGLSRILMGSVTEKVTREIPCSFITTRSQDIARDYFESNLGEIEAYLQKASHHMGDGNFKKAIDCYTSGLKQFPDNVPLLMGLINAYKSDGNTLKSSFFTDYARDLVRRTWGEGYITIFNLD